MLNLKCTQKFTTDNITIVQIVGSNESLSKTVVSLWSLLPQFNRQQIFFGIHPTDQSPDLYL
jgi:hypothetical protein